MRKNRVNGNNAAAILFLNNGQFTNDYKYSITGIYIVFSSQCRERVERTT